MVGTYLKLRKNKEDSHCKFIFMKYKHEIISVTVFGHTQILM